MRLPESDRVIYGRNPLIEVVCQLRFPPILKISHQEPVEFQDEIRSKYPLFEATQAQLPPEISQFIQKAGLPFQGVGGIAYAFRPEDKKWNLSVSKDSISLSTSYYEQYEQFRERLEEALGAFERTYKPSFYTRLGLRYQNLIIPSKLEISDVDWSKLIAKNFAPELHDPDLSSALQTSMNTLVLKVEGGQVNFRHGLVFVKDPQKSSDEQAYLFDADFYTEQKIEGVENAWSLLDQFNRSAGNLFRWCITNDLHEAMAPQSTELQ